MAVFRSLLCKGRRPFRCGSPWTVATLHRHTPLLLRHERIIKLKKIIFQKKRNNDLSIWCEWGKNLQAFFPFFFRSTVIDSPSSRRQIIFGAGNPSALHVMLIFWFSRTATDDGVLSMSNMFGGTVNFHFQKYILN